MLLVLNEISNFWDDLSGTSSITKTLLTTLLTSAMLTLPKAPCSVTRHILSCASFFAETSVRSPRKLAIFHIYFFFLDQSIQKIFDFILEKAALILSSGLECKSCFFRPSTGLHLSLSRSSGAVKIFQTFFCCFLLGYFDPVNTFF